MSIKAGHIFKPLVVRFWSSRGVTWKEVPNAIGSIQ